MIAKSTSIHLPRSRAALPQVTLHSFIRFREGFSYLQHILQLFHPDQRMENIVCSPDPRSCPSRTRVPFQPAFLGWHHAVLFEVGGSTSGHGSQTSSINCGRKTVRSTRRYLWLLISRASCRTSHRAKACGGAIRRRVSSPHFR